MKIQYLQNLDGNIFDIIGNKSSEGIKINTILINPLCRFIDNEANSQFLINATSNYMNKLSNIKIVEETDNVITAEENHFIFGVIKTDDGVLQFNYSELFSFSNDDFDFIKNKSIELAEILIAVLRESETSIIENLELELTEMMEYNYVPIDEGVVEILGVVINNHDNNSIDLTARYYASDKSNDGAKDNVISSMFNELYPLISDSLKTYNLFFVNEPITIIKLGLSQDGEYLIDTNASLLTSLDDSTLQQIKDILLKTYELL